MDAKIKAQIDFLQEELVRVKVAINTMGFDVTTAPYVICNNYRNSIKRQLNLLYGNLEN